MIKMHKNPIFGGYKTPLKKLFTLSAKCFWNAYIFNILSQIMLIKTQGYWMSLEALPEIVTHRVKLKWLVVNDCTGLYCIIFCKCSKISYLEVVPELPDDVDPVGLSAIVLKSHLRH